VFLDSTHLLHRSIGIYLTKQEGVVSRVPIMHNNLGCRAIMKGREGWRFRSCYCRFLVEPPRWRKHETSCLRSGYIYTGEYCFADPDMASREEKKEAY